LQSFLNQIAKVLKPFEEHVLNGYYNKEEYGNQIEKSSREEAFERRWNRARALLFKNQ